MTENTTMKMMIGLAALLVVAVVGYAGYSTFKPAPEASAPITAAPVTAASAATNPAAAGTVYRIDQEASTARFVVDEVLRGSPKTVVGTTNQVAGEIAANLNDIDAASVGEIRINARTLSTDAEGRNRMLQNRILETEEHEFITFAPTSLVGCPTRRRSARRSPFRWSAT
jgi:polyisoprenoid-binding protein YceI